MYRIYYAEKDATLYEKFPEQNTGIDQILEISKIASGSQLNGIVQGNTTNSRILIDFGTEITSLSQSIVDGEIPALNKNNVKSGSVFLNLRAANASDLLQTYSIFAFPVSESWTNGGGNYSDTPIQTFGCSWYYRDSKDEATEWATGSAESVTDGVGATETEGGGTYTTTVQASQTFTNESPDIRMDVTDIVKGWVEGDRPNHGFILKRRRTDEISGAIQGTLQFFSRETHTIYVPRLEVCFDDSAIGSSDNVITSNLYVPYIKNIKSKYTRDEIARFQIGVRPEFPAKTFQTSSFFFTDNQLPVSSSYEIYDAETEEILMKDEKLFGNSKTKISTNVADGSFFDIRMDSFFPERYYRIRLKCRRSNDTQVFSDFYFRVVR